MTWIDARPVLAAAIEAKAPTVRMPGRGSRFHYEDGASLLTPPKSRGFWFEWERGEEVPCRWRTRTRLICAYDVEKKYGATMDALAVDPVDVAAAMNGIASQHIHSILGPGEGGGFVVERVQIAESILGWAFTLTCEHSR